MGLVDDDWYSAHQFLGVAENQQNRSELFRMYYTDQPANVLGCITRKQFCDPVTKFCSPLDSGSMPPNLFSSEEQKQLFWYWATATKSWPTDLHQLPQILGNRALQARANFYDGVQGPLPPNQWMQEVLHWHTLSLATIQRLTVEMAIGPSDASMNRYVNKTVPKFSTRQSCLPQKVRSTAFTSFSMLGLAVILILGSLIILFANAVDPFFAFLRKRHKKGTYRHLEWVSNDTLQLQRMVHEELGLGAWIGAADTIPVTRPEEYLGVLDVSDEKHPIMVRGASSSISAAVRLEARQDKLPMQTTIMRHF